MEIPAGIVIDTNIINRHQVERCCRARARVLRYWETFGSRCTLPDSKSVRLESGTAIDLFDVYTPAQRLSLHLEAIRPGRGLPTGFWISAGFELDGPVGYDRLIRAIIEVQRSSSAYSVLVGIGLSGAPVSRPCASPPPIETIDLSDFHGGMDEFARMHETELLSSVESPARRFRIGRCGDNVRYTHLMLHYLAADRSTVTGIFNAVRAIYESRGDACARKVLCQRLHPLIDEAQLDYWRTQLGERAFIPKIAPSKSELASPSSLDLSRELSQQAAEALRKLTLECGATSTAVGLAAWAEYTHLLSGASDILVPTLAPDMQADEDGDAGHALNLIMLRSQRDAKRAFKAAVRDMTGCVLNALDNQVALMALIERGVLRDSWLDNGFVIVFQGLPSL